MSDERDWHTMTVVELENLLVVLTPHLRRLDARNRIREIMDELDRRFSGPFLLNPGWCTCRQTCGDEGHTRAPSSLCRCLPKSKEER